MKKTVISFLLILIPLIALGEETPTLKTLRDLIRIDTSNPPGNETPAAHYVQDLLAREGISS